MSKSKRTTGVQEWAEHSINCCVGCANDCVYCYAAEMAARFGRRERNDWAREQLVDREKILTKARRTYQGRVMFPTTHDITPGTVDLCGSVLRELLSAGNDVLVVSKANPACIHALINSIGQTDDCWPYDAPKPELRVSIGSEITSTLKTFEPNAPIVSARCEAATVAMSYGWPVSISAEPLLQAGGVGEMVWYFDRFVQQVDGRGGTIWIGKCNHLVRRTAEWASTNIRRSIIRDLAKSQTDEAVCAIFDAVMIQVPSMEASVRWKDSYAEVLMRCGKIPAAIEHDKGE